MYRNKGYAKYLDDLLPKMKELYEKGISNEQIGKQLEIHRSTVRNRARDNNWKRPEKDISNITQEGRVEPKEYKPLEYIKSKNKDEEIKRLKIEKEMAHAEFEELLKVHEVALALQTPSTYTIPKIEFNTKGPKSQAIPIIQFSDWHVEERVDKKTTHGLNEFNPDIARKRIDKLTENTIKLILKERQNVQIDKLFICLGGDMINSYLHEHDVQQNYMSPIEACNFAKELICKSLATIAEYSKVKHIDVMCIRGNHPRLTKKMSSSTDYKMNLEALIYNSVKEDRLMREDIFSWHIPESEFGYIQIGNKIIRNMHGHEVNYMGGIGGITIPLIKYIMRLNDTIKADYNTMHHFHTLDMIGACNTSINGSVVGYNSYAMKLGAKFEEPKQSFQLLDMKRGFTLRSPIFCE